MKPIKVEKILNQLKIHQLLISNNAVCTQLSIYHI